MTHVLYGKNQVVQKAKGTILCTSTENIWLCKLIYSFCYYAADNSRFLQICKNRLSNGCVDVLARGTEHLFLHVDILSMDVWLMLLNVLNKEWDWLQK